MADNKKKCGDDKGDESQKKKYVKPLLIAHGSLLLLTTKAWAARMISN
ncbi:MAG: hypothetical protein WC881_07730 [Elusimicrobiota bacterium]|jgi:hypothetical protein